MHLPWTGVRQIFVLLHFACLWSSTWSFWAKPVLRRNLDHRAIGAAFAPCSPLRLPFTRMQASILSTSTATPVSGALVNSTSASGQDRGAYDDALTLYKTLRADDDSSMADKVHTALDVVEQALRLYGPSHVFASYNGGKDAVVVMHLLRAALARHVQAYDLDSPAPADTASSSPSSGPSTIPRPRLVYFEQPSTEFPEVKALVSQTTQRYDLDLRVYQDVPFAQGLKACIEGEGGAPLAFLLGTRKGDPNCKEQETFAPSSTWMPAFMRVNPILSWTYGEIWHFLRRYNLPYCSLYDQGYTSLGKVDDTRPNPALAKSRARDDAQEGGEGGGAGGVGGGEFYPAYMLTDWDLERAGRVDKKKEATARAVSNKGVEGDGCRAVEEAAAAAAKAAAQGEGKTPVMSAKASSKGWNKASGGQSKEAAEGGGSRESVKTAGLVIIGDEILKGKTSDTNSLYAARRLREKGVAVQRIVVLSDNHADIEQEVRRQASLFDVVITSGGVGPTHDDLTIKAVAAALGQGVQENEEMIQRLQDAYGVASRDDLSEGQRKMALLPEQARLRVPPPPPSPTPAPTPPSAFTTEAATVAATTATAAAVVAVASKTKVWPILMCGNVYVLPGVPSFFEAKMDTIVDHFLNHFPIYTRKIVLGLDEVEIVEALNQAVAHFEPEGCVFGSYPFYGETRPRVVITLESGCEKTVEAATAFLIESIPKEAVLQVGKDDDLRGGEGQVLDGEIQGRHPL
ncbi:fad synthetase [Nannochloropsis gaditana]|uniref:FAD synthase n=1 Tax=Nannochloropsis gaditana TaxID=72520 RepID=W7TLV9_9STRA|nr:fad synthetase [Nannochloropsis gaditana]